MQVIVVSRVFRVGRPVRNDERMGSRSASELLQLPVHLHGIHLGRPVDVLLDLEDWRALGLVVLCGDESRRFLVFAAADLGDDAIAVPSALLLLEDVEFYLARSRSLRSLLGCGVVNGRHGLGELRDLLVGAVGYLINLAVYDGLLHAKAHYLVAATCSFLVAVTSNYTWNRLWTFREHRGHVGIQGMRFFLVSLAALGANLVVLDLLIAYGDLGKLPAQAVAIVVVTPLNFVGNKLWSFRRAKA